MSLMARPGALTLAGSLVLAAWGPAQAAPPASAAPEVSVVTVLGRMAPRTSPRVRRLSSSSASSCAYDVSSSQQAFIDSYLDSFQGRERGHVGDELDTRVEGDAQAGASFSDTSPYGDATGAGKPLDAEDREGRRSACTQASYSAAAGRNQIARTDKSLAEAYAAYDRGDYARALASFQASYNKVGWDEAALMAGTMYEAGQGTARDPRQAAAWYEKLALARLSAAHYSKFDPKAPQQGTPRIEAQVRLAQLAITSGDMARARSWYRQAAELDHVPARYTLGRMLYSGFGGERDVAGGLKLYASAALSGYVPAQLALAQVSQENDPQGAFGWWQKVAVNAPAGRDKVEAQYALAQAYDEGLGVAGDPARALAFYKLAAVAGHPAAQNALGTYFFQGQQVGQDLPLARKLFLAAASQGLDAAMVNASAMLYRGEGGVRDPVQALSWLRLGAKLGNAQAVQGALVMEKSLAPDELARVNAVVQ